MLFVVLFIILLDVVLGMLFVFVMFVLGILVIVVVVSWIGVVFNVEKLLWRGVFLLFGVLWFVIFIYCLVCVNVCYRG